MEVVLLLVMGSLAQGTSWPTSYLGDATSPNQGRMIEWCPPPPESQEDAVWVHATWVNGAAVEYTRSTNAGASWDVPAVVPSYYPFGTVSPALRTGPGASAWVCKRASNASPSELECAVKPPPPYPWEVSRIGGGGLLKSPLSTALSTTSGDPMVYMVTTYYAADDGQSRLVFWAFDHTLPWATVHHTTILATCNTVFDFHASIDYSPGDRAHIVYRDYDGHIRYFTWSNPLTPDELRAGVPPDWTESYPVSVENTPQEPGSRPFIDADGECAYCVWRGHNEAGMDIGEIYCAVLDLGASPPAWIDQERVFESPDAESNFPQCYTGTTVVWQEQVGDKSEVYGRAGGMVQCISDDPDYDNLWPQASVKNPVPPDPWVVRCHTLWSKDKPNSSDDSFCYKQHKFIPLDFALPEYPTYLNAVVGHPKATRYCLERDGYIEYRTHRVDYSRTSLAYSLPHLDPSRDYLVQFTLFNGESLSITQSVNFGGRAAAVATLRPGVCETLYAYLPKTAYRSTKALVEVTRLSGPFACVAQDIRVYETWRRPASDGGQAQPSQLQARTPRVLPSPFHTSCVFTLGPGASSSHVRVYDANGRLVRTIQTSGLASSERVAIWDGRDLTGSTVPAGVYTCVAGKGSTVEHIRVVRQ